MPPGKDASRLGTVPGIALVLALPFVLLGWLLVDTAREHVERYRQMDAVIAGFREGLALADALETMRDLAPASILLDVPDIAARHVEARETVAARLPAFVARLRAQGNPALDGHADRLEAAWADLNLQSQVSGPRESFHAVDRFNDDVYAALSGLFFVTDMATGEPVSANELLLVVLDTMRKARRELGVIRSVALYTALRDGYFSSDDAAIVDNAWDALYRLSASFRAQQFGMQLRLGSPSMVDTAPVSAYLARIDEQMLMTARLDSGAAPEWTEGEAAMGLLREAAGELIGHAEDLVHEARRQRLQFDGTAAAGLVLLYALLTALLVSLYRTRDQAIRAQADSRAKSLFLARMSHEIRTPLNGVLGLAELLADTQPTPRQREYIDLIGSAGRSLATLVNDVLDLAKIEAGKLELEQVPVDPRALATESVQVFSVAAGRNRTLVFCHVAADVPASIPGDPVRLRQVLLNLVGNAVKFTERGRVELRLLRRLDVREGPRLRIEVRDTGIGLAPDQLDTLFERFEQASSDVARRFGGTGLGLSISRELVELMGGTIGVRSTPGAGSTFWFELPLPADAAPPPTRAQAAVTEPVLLVDADGHLVNALRQLASDRIPPLFTAADALDAQAVLNAHPAIRFAVVNGQRSAADAAATAGHLHDFHPGVRVRILVAVGDSLPGQPAAGDDSLACSVFTDHALTALVTPPRPVAARPAPASRFEAPPLERLRVLVAEDNAVNRMVTAGMLEKLGVTAELVDDGAQAVARYRERGGAFDVVLMDLDMPVMDGATAAVELRRLEHAAGWPRRRVLALSAHVSSEHAQLAREAGMDGQVPKPVTLAALRDALAGGSG